MKTRLYPILEMDSNVLDDHYDKAFMPTKQDLWNFLRGIYYGGFSVL